MKKYLNKRKHIFATSLILFLSVLFTMPILAEEDSPSADLSVAFLSAYIWRGQELSRSSIVIQPSMTISYKDFSANMWSNLDTNPYAPNTDNPSSLNETDLTLSYGKSFGPLGVEGGYIYYGLDGFDDSQEIYVSLGLDVLLSPGLTIYREVSYYNHWYFLLGISHSFQITDAIGLDLSGSVSYLLSADEDAYPKIDDNGLVTGDKFSNLHDGIISVGLPIAVAKYFTVTPSLSYTFPLSGAAGDEMKFRSLTGEDNSWLYGGITLDFAL